MIPLFNGHLFAVASVLFIRFLTSIRRPANYLSMKHLELNFFTHYTVDAKRPKKHVNDILHFFCTLSTRRNTLHFNYVPSVLELELCRLEMHLMFCYNEFWIYLHICSLFKSILLYRVNKIMFTAIPIQFILYLY